MRESDIALTWVLVIVKRRRGEWWGEREREEGEEG